MSWDGSLQLLSDSDLEGVDVAVLYRDSLLDNEFQSSQIKYRHGSWKSLHTTHFYFDSETAAVEDCHYGNYLSFNDLVILWALLDRPTLDQYALNVNILFQARKEPVKYSAPYLNTILHDTYGLLVFQEQLTEIVQQIGGFSKEESDKLRRYMGKKSFDELEKMRPAFIQNDIKNGYTAQQAEDLFQWMCIRSIYLIKRKFAEKAIKQWLSHLSEFYCK